MAIKIESYKQQYQATFKALNIQWIEMYFTVEETDLKALDHPQAYILDPGGAILVAVNHGEIVGVCALIKIEEGDHDFELAKMAVSPAYQGKGIGFLLGQSIIEKARQLGSKKLYLESNTALVPAINLYKKLGFQEISGVPTPYARCNIQMELFL